MHTARLNRLQNNLTHDDPATRRTAAEDLGEGDERAIYPLIKALRDENIGVQDAAMRSLMSIKSEPTVYMVLPLLRENAFLRNTALLILQEMGKIAVPLLYILLDDSDEDIRKFSLDLIHDIKYCNYPEKILELLAGDPNVNVRASAAKTIGILQYKKAIPQLVKALSDEEWVCFSALEALTAMHADDSIDAILNLLKHPLESLRFAAIEALGELRSSKATEPLITHIARAKDYEKLAAVKSLIEIGPVPALPDISDALMKVLSDEDLENKLIAVKGLASIKYENAIKPIIDLAGSLDMSDPDNEEISLTIRHSLQSFGCNKHLIEILKDPTVKYRGKVMAIEIAGNLKCAGAVPMLVDLLNSDYRDIRRSSINSLGKIENDTSKECLIEAMRDHDSHVRKSAVSSIGKIGDMSAFEPLMTMLHNEHYSDIIDESIIALMSINSTLFLDRVTEFNNSIQERAARYESNVSAEDSC